MTTNIVECKDCAYGREANVPNAVFCMLNHQTFPIPVYGCTNGRPGRIVPQTNYDRIISKTPEELAEWIAKVLIYHNVKMCVKCERSCPLYKCCNDQASDNIEDWLKSPVEEVGNVCSN